MTALQEGKGIVAVLCFVEVVVEGKAII